MLLGISTGCYYGRVSAEKKHSTALKSDFEAVEITDLESETFLKTRFDKEEILKIRNASFSSIHAPVYNVSYENNNTSNKVVTMIKKLYDTLDCSNIVFHHDTIKDEDYFFKEFKGYNISIENLDIRFVSQQPLNKMSYYFSANPELGFTLDVCHALEYCEENLEVLVSNFRDKIAEVHWSYPYKGGRHYSVVDVLKKEKKEEGKILKILNLIAELDKPVILEFKGGYYNNIESVINEDYRLINNFEKVIRVNDKFKYYKEWVKEIAVNHSVEMINNHMVKHLEEDKKDYDKWMISTSNIFDVFNLVKGVDKSSELCMKYDELLSTYNKSISIESKLNRLLFHNIRHPETIPPL